MVETSAVGGLKWVKDEIIASLGQVRGRLEAFVEGGLDPDLSLFKETIPALGEVRGVLSALQLIGPTRLTDEIQTLCKELASASVSNTGEVSEALMLALIRLPDYLDRVSAGQADAPLALLPAINDLRASRGAAPMSEAEVLVPPFAFGDSEMPSPDVRASLGRIAGKVRSHFHLSLLQWLRGNTPREGLAELGKLCRQLQGRSGAGLFHDLFQVAAAVVEALLAGNIADDSKSKTLIAHLDRVIKPFTTDPHAWPQAQAQALLPELLSLIVQSKSRSQGIDELLATYGLELPTGEEEEGQAGMDGGLGPEAYSALIVEARKELAPVKDALDLFARGDRTGRRQLLRLVPQLGDLANTLSVTGADDLVRRLRNCGEELEAMGQGSVPTDDPRLVMVAEELLSVEVALGDLGAADNDEGGREDQRALVSHTLREMRVDIANAEQAISRLVAAPSDHHALREVPNLFRQVAGALRVLSESSAAQVLDLIVLQVEQRFLQSAHAPDEKELDLLAQAISGIDLYIAGLSEGEGYRPDLLAEARGAIDELRAVPTSSVAWAVEETPLAGEEEPSTEEVATEELARPTTEIDQGFLDIFVEEAQDEERTISEHFARWQEDKSDEAALTTLRRSFHTLKGSGRLVGAIQVGELGRAVETLLNRVIDGTLTATSEVTDCVAEAVRVLPELIVAEARQEPVDVNELVNRAETLVLSAPPEGAAPEFADEERKAAKVIPWPASAQTPVSAEVWTEDVTSVGGPESELPALVPDEVEAQALAEQEESAEIAALAEADEELLDIFGMEARGHLDVLRSFLARVEEEGVSAIPDEPVVRALHTLTGSARMTGVQSTAKVTAPLERLFLSHQAQSAEADAPLLRLLDQAIEAIEARLEHLPGSGDEMAALRELAGELQGRLARLEPAEEEKGTLVEGLEAPLPPEEEAATEPPVPLLTDEEEMELLSMELEEPPVSEEEIPGPELVEEAVSEEVTAPEELSDEAIAEEEISEPEVEEELIAEGPIAVPEETEEEAISAPAVGAPEVPEPPEKVIPPVGPTEQEIPAAAVASFVPLPQDQELISLFLEDARDIVDRLDQSLRDLQLAPTELGPLEEMQRSLHTLKGSSRLSGLSPIGDLSHAFESLLIAITHGEARVADDTLELAQRTLDTLSDQIDAVEQHANLRRADELVQALALALEVGLASATETAPQVAVLAPSPASQAEPGAGAPPSIPSPAEPAATAPAAVAEGATPQIRVRSDLIDRLVNNAGEISIYRSRLAQQGGLMTFRLGELERTVERLRGQLRQLEIETEAQILHRYERRAEPFAPAQEGFDPLELDRFSTLQQLSRSLAETVNDLVSLRILLRDLQSESDTLLQQQARISNDLQDGLLRTRMAPFVQIVPRLHRVVRQTAQQMGKEARLEVFGPEVELDRSIQERILAPLEHLLRNAIAHGIELPEQRVREGKEPSGVVTLVLNREGNDVVITVADDGAGLDLEAIRKRALARGLIAESAELGEEELTGLILESGFSTVDEVSQIAGRGVGLDVVNTEVKQLSGSFSLETHPGRGTSFTIRLPLTLAIIDALLVQLGDQIFAIPHATIDALSRISRSDLLACYQGSGKDFPYGGRDYRVMYLGAMLQLIGVPELGERRFQPVVLARSGEQRIAFHVDQLLGNQRIVVKPLGPELSNIRWLSGGTILADGRVAMILDLLALLRSAAMQEYRPFMQPEPQERKRRPCVLVVDDSLTVRRVTSRMLQRQNMDVITAQDGIDALTRLEERLPDVILLDIEMPRMDGYELTRHIRRSERLGDIPIIMITSRTGEKHRRHALDLGVDRYLGKPYQEADLLDEISSVLVEASL